MPEKTFPSLYVTENSDTTTRREDDGMVDDKSKELSLSKLECRSHCSGAYEKVRSEKLTATTDWDNIMLYGNEYNDGYIQYTEDDTSRSLFRRKKTERF
jgi:hypothetical protein